MTDTTICTRCVMNSEVDPDLVLTDGVCNHCQRYDQLLTTRIVPVAERQPRLEALVETMKAAGQGHEYDCVIGVSGGVDSSYVAMKVRELGLRPLAVHVDNGWNSSLASSNIEKVLRALDIDLITEVLNLDEFYGLQRAFLHASTPDADVPSDHAIQATLWKVARKHHIKFIISGMNFATESISVPSWSYGHSDWRYISAVHRADGGGALRSYPHYGFAELAWTTLIKRVRIVSILNYLEYDKAEAVEQLKSELGWTPYEGKHYESIYTRWVQGFYLPHKFQIDKRRGHYSDLINSGQISRADALLALEQDDYPESLRRIDAQLLRKKLSLSEEDYEQILRTPPRSFREFRNSYAFVQFLRRTVNLLRRFGLYPR
ncbi:N-acetyl sugar amidotransferase [Microbacterium keratanolyticum]|uniref:N-acetyl sugar amidotransferase n=1 Tax=Microbacterium keratanolyticum TaxID=67574 RepID=UPI0036453A39